MKSKRLILIPAALLSVAFTVSVQAQSTAFTYQGRLQDNGNPANGAYDLRFILYNADVGGSQQGPILTNSAVHVTNGLFTVMLDFNNQFPGADRWLEIAVRTNNPANPASFITLSPRQRLTPAPYAITAGNVVSGGLPATYSSPVTFNNVANNFTGSGAGLTSLNASSLSGGTVPEARLSGNVALLDRNQTFTHTNFFAGIGIGVGSLVAPLQVANSGASGLSDGYTPSVWGDSSGGDGVFGSTSDGGGYGIYGASSGDGGVGVFGSTSATNGVGVWAEGASSSSPALTIGLGGFQVSGAGTNTATAAFIHQVTSTNLYEPPGGSEVFTFINNPLCDGDPNAILIVTPRITEGNPYYAHPFNVVYIAELGKWAIVNADNTSAQLTDAFNVLVIKP